MKYWLYQDWFSILGKQCEYVHCCMWRFCQCFDLLCVFFFFVPERQHFKHVPFRAHVNCATVSADYTPPAIIKLKTNSFTAMATYEKLNAVMPPCAPKTRSVWMKVCITAWYGSPACSGLHRSRMKESCLSNVTVLQQTAH